MHDNEMVDLFFARNERAIAEVKAKYGALCLKAARNLLLDAQASEECVSDMLLALWNSIPPERPCSLKAYALGITKKCALKTYRQRNAQKRGGNIRIESLDELESCLPGGESVEKCIEARALSALLNQWLGELEASDRALFLKRYWFEQEVRQIAESAGTTCAWVSKRLYSLRQKLKKYLEKEGFFV